MPRNTTPFSQLKQTETDIAVLQVEQENIEEKVNELKTDLKSMRIHIDDSILKTQVMIRDYHETNTEAYQKVSDRVSQLEKWKWSVVGATTVIGVIIWHFVSKTLNLG